VIANPVSTVDNMSPQVVEVVRDSEPDTFFGVKLGSGGLPLDATSTLITVAWDMYVEPTGDTSGAFGPYFGVHVFADPAGGLTLLGSLGVDATTGELLYQATGTGELVAPGVTGLLGAWHSFAILLDYVAQEYSIFLDGSQVVGNIGFVDGSFTTFSDADLAGLPGAGDAASLALGGTAYYDNYVITQDVVPEPMSVVVWGLGALIASGVYSVRKTRRTRRSATGD
jgi:hypothetical protein